MRKDLVLGLSIGGVLLLLVVVYVAFKPPNNPHRPITADAGDASSDVAGSGPATAPSDLTRPAAVADASSAPPVAENTNYFLRSLYRDHRGSTALEAYQSGSDRATAPATLPAPTPGSAGPALSPALTPRHSSPPPAMGPMAPPPSLSGATSAGPAPAPAGPAVHTYVVKNGDTPSSIAIETYGSANYYPYILRANPNLDPKHMKIGMVINLPDPSVIHPEGSNHTSAATPAADHAAAPIIDPKTQYVVESGDSLYKISVKLYHNSLMMDAIYAANKDEIGPDMAALKVHQVLKLPKPLAAAPTTQN